MAKDKITNEVPEWRLQSEMAAELNAMCEEFPWLAFAASLEGVVGNLNPYQSQLARAQGMKAGEPDLRLYYAGGRVVFVEVKKIKGRWTVSQKERIPLLRSLGFTVHILRVGTPDEARAGIRAIALAEFEGRRLDSADLTR